MFCFWFALAQNSLRFLFVFFLLAYSLLTLHEIKTKKTKEKQTEVKSGGIMYETWSCLKSRQECEAAKKSWFDASSNHKSTGRLSFFFTLLSANSGRSFPFIFVCLFSLNSFADARLKIVRTNKTLMICFKRNVRRRYHNYMRWTCSIFFFVCSVFIESFSSSIILV